MLEINWDDVVNVINLCLPYLIGFGIFLVLAVTAFVIVQRSKKLSNHNKAFYKVQVGLSVLTALTLVVNLICFIPLSTLITLSTGSGRIQEKTMDKAKELAEEISGEGIILLENKNQSLPLQKNIKLNVFGWSSTNPVYGGTGSGSLSDLYPTVSLLEGLKNAGIETNEELSKFYTDYRDTRPEVGLFTQDWTLPEPPVKSYGQSLLDNAKSFSNKAMVVITRVGGEGADLPSNMTNVTYENNSEEYADFSDGQHYLELTQSERDMIDLVAQNFEDVTLVYNGANPIELGFVEEIPQIKSVLWVPGLGQTGFNALGDIVTGEINPSGRTVDTVAYDFTTNPTWNNFGDFTYTNMNEFAVDSEYTDGQPTFVNYVEGIYSGYKFYETAAQEGLFNYDTTVQYPFGYGLSYTNFTQDMGEAKVATDGTISVDVTVTNNGAVAGKDVVELYYSAPYTNGGIEKSTVNLAAFGKTKKLEPGESETLNLTFKQEDMASFDTHGTGYWILDSGDYTISLRKNSHEVIESSTVTVPEKVVYNEMQARSTDKQAATTQFSYLEGSVTYLSRANQFANYQTATASPSSYDMTDAQKANFYNDSNYKPEDFNNASDQMPATGANNGLHLIDLRGVDYDDPKWDNLLDQLRVEDMTGLVALGGYQTAAVKSVGKVNTTDLDGPASINNNFTRVASIGLPSAVVLSATYNAELSKKFGDIIGEMAEEMEVSGWYAPGANLHRSPFGGRNFEYYSEDSLLAGKIATAAIQGAAEHGVYAYVKHFALNDQETNRWRMLTIFATEQALRENYLKPFELAVKEGGASAIMSAYNYIGTEWAGSSKELLNTVLRDEWGFKGMVVTDYFAGFGYMDMDRAIRNGGDFALIAYDNHGNYVDDTTSATAVKSLRQASKNIFYTVVNSRAYEEGNYNMGLRPWQVVLVAVDIVIILIIGLLEWRAYKKYKVSRDEVSIG